LCTAVQGKLGLEGKYFVFVPDRTARSHSALGSKEAAT
jgi:hypothetical protein